jgi:epoxide hydrolase-like predicted phosphatase
MYVAQNVLVFNLPISLFELVYKKLAQNFDVFIESSKVGMRKPDPRIYQLCLDKLSLKAEECVYLDDIGFNLKPPKAMVSFVETFSLRTKADAQICIGFQNNSRLCK